MRSIIAYFKIKKRNLVLINNVTHQRETLSKRPVRLLLTLTLNLGKFSNKEKVFGVHGMKSDENQFPVKLMQFFENKLYIFDSHVFIFIPERF